MNRVPRILAVLSVVGLSITLSACGSKPPPEGESRPALATTADVGPPLYAKQPMPKLERLPAGVEPVVISQAVIQPDERVQIASQVDGTLLLYGVKLASKPAVIDGNVISQKYVNEKGEVIAEQYFRRLREGQSIEKDEIIVRLDEEMIGIQLRANQQSLEKTKEAVVASAKQVKASDNYLERMQAAGAGASANEVLSAIAQKARAEGEYAQTVREQAKLQGETEITQFKFNQCFVRSPVDGRIVKFLKHPGEGVKAGEPLLEVQSSKRFRAEGKVDVQEANRIRLFTPAEVIPIRPVAPEPYSISHLKEVSAIAVTAHADRPLVVSAGMDATALVWEPLSSEKAVHVLPHPPGIGVKSVAVTGKTDANTHFAVTGGTDGKLRLWDLTDPNNLPKRPAAEFEEGLGGAVSALAFSPDGRYLAAAAGREVTVWSVADRKKKYALPAEHRDDVTAVRFTPQGTLVTVCRDKAVRVWAVGTDSAAVAQLIDSRSGTVDILDVSSDGGKMLFDKDPGQLNIVSLEDGRSVGSMQNGGGMRFAGFALFGPDDRFVLTAGGDTESRGEMQLWEIGRAMDPVGSKKGASPRAVERRRLVVPNRVAVTAAAFSPHPTKRFMVVGTAAGGVHYWVPPAANEPYRTIRGKVTAILPSDSRTSTVRVEVDLPDAKTAEILQDRGTAAILIDPTDTPEPPRLPLSAPPAGGGTGARAVTPGTIIPTGGLLPVPKK